MGALNESRDYTKGVDRKSAQANKATMQCPRLPRRNVGTLTQPLLQNLYLNSPHKRGLTEDYKISLRLLK